MAKKTKASKYITDNELLEGLEELFKYDLTGLEATDVSVGPSVAGGDSKAVVTFTMSRPDRESYDNAKAMQAEMNKIMAELEKQYKEAEVGELLESTPELATS